MSLLNNAMTDCVTLIQTDVPDGAGDYITQWTEGKHFKAAFDFQASMAAKVAEFQGVKGLWNVLVPREVSLEYHNVFKRIEDGVVFRITSKDDKATPKGAGLNLRLVSAEEWSLE